MNPSEGLKSRENHYQQTHRDQSEQTWGSGGCQKSCLPQEGKYLTKYHTPPNTHLLSTKGMGDPMYGFMQWTAVSTH